ncbi:MAG: hypothetical protein ACRCU2_32620 [Planktothrix sp.]
MLSLVFLPDFRGFGHSRARDSYKNLQFNGIVAISSLAYGIPQDAKEGPTGTADGRRLETRYR